MFTPQINMKRLPILVAGAMLFIVIATSFITSFEHKYRLSSSMMHKWLTDFSGEALVYFIGWENRYFTQELPKESKPPALSSVLLELATSIKPGDIRSLLGNELPGFALYDSTIIVAGKGTDYTNIGYESPPPMELLLSGEDAEVQDIERLEDPDSSDSDNPPNQTTDGKTVAYIYHSHSWESFLPHLKGVTNPDHAIHSKVNITMVGKKLGEDLEAHGIGTSVDMTNMTELLRKNNTDYRKSYPMSRTLVQSAMASNHNLQLIFDLHRDSSRRKTTTATIDGKSYARVLFVIGTANPHFEKNQEMAKEIDQILSKKFPGLSRGVIGKNKTKGNGVYNQDLSDHSLLIEFGGVDNNMDELYRSADAVADAVAQYYWNKKNVKAE
ncbi:stage II sporulation protein P [Fictibacillus barbaricus]|uniref:Stage II sporulation protein P n=1 Tax=Fictibacillus barbaricus TaxID=182136 RepID=A0ABU1TVN0_9BACL|nr:stage II sporulation protein P [Fictibacillus barbaricus]MDR7071237.1 stage II sporulation protein P [Fictibacillus barbaricus]